ncbi:MAG: hypothetical protein AAB637_02155 [Patescibacteria group bacterium]
MLTPQNKQLNSIFERIIRDNNGVLVRVRFTIVEVDGVFKGHVISAEPLVSKNEKDVVCLLCLKEKKVIAEDAVIDFSSILSPYFSLEFFMSQPTRAPAFAI